jgi:uncharacterized protein YdeI (YjbR/CyaY-like superfamily)
MAVKKEYPQVHPLTREEWRAWLEENHDRQSGVWLISFKASTGKGRITWDEIVEEAICYGWIDSVQRTLDAERSMQLITPRKPGSPWSALNKRRIEHLEAAGRLAPPGVAKIEAAKRDGSWSAADAVEALMVPPDLAEALARQPVAEANFAAFSPSAKKQLLWWIHSAKRPETRTKRIETVVASAAEKVNPLASRD